MAQLTFPIKAAGLEVPVWIGLSGRAMNDLRAAGQSIPFPLQARGLIDTGTNVTSVASWLLHRLAIPIASASSTHTAQGKVGVNLYEVGLLITDPALPGSPNLTQPDLVVMELPATLPDADVLIGLDVLLERKLLVDGPARHFIIEF